MACEDARLLNYTFLMGDAGDLKHMICAAPQGYWVITERYYDEGEAAT